MTTRDDFHPVRSADRTIDLLELLAEHPGGVSFNDIIKHLNIPRSSLSGLLRTLTARRYITKTPDGKRFQLGLKVLELSASYLQGSDLLDLARQAIQKLVREFGETAQVAVLDGADVIYVATEHSQHSMRIASRIGRRLPAHATAVGKSLLAMLPDDTVNQLLPAQLEPLTPHTITARADLKRELALTRRLGYAYDAEEFAVGLHCIAAPILDESGRAVASISVSIPAARLHEVGISRVPAAVIDTAAEASRGIDWHARRWKQGQIKVAWSMGSFHVEAYQILYRAVESLRADLNVDVIWTDAKENAVKQASDVASLLALKPDVIVIHPVHAQLAEELFSQAARAGIQAINFQRPVRGLDVEYFIGGDTYQQGRMTAAFVAQALRGQGNVALIEGDPYNDNSRNLAQGVRDELRTHPNIQIVIDQPCLAWSRDKARELSEAILSEYGEQINAFIAANDDMAGGVAEALDKYHWAGKIILVGGDGDLEALERIQSGVQHGTALQNWIELGKATLHFAAAVAQGRVDRSQMQRRSIFRDPPGPLVYAQDLPYTFIDRSNISVLEQFWTEALSTVLPDMLPALSKTLKSARLSRSTSYTA